MPGPKAARGIAITASNNYKKRKLAQAPGDTQSHPLASARPEPQSPPPSSPSLPQTSSDIDPQNPSPPRYIPPHLQAEISDASNEPVILSAASSPTDAYAALSLNTGHNTPIMADPNRQDDDSLEEGLPTALGSEATTGDVSMVPSTRGSSPPKRDASHMDEDDDVDMRESIEVDEPGLSGSKNSADSTQRRSERLHARSVSVEMGGDEQQLEGTTGASSSRSATTSASANDSSATTSIGSSPFHMTSTTDDRITSDADLSLNRPSYDEQYAEVMPLISGATIKEGDVGYIVSSKWLERVLIRTSNPPDGVDKNAAEGEVGPVDNSAILLPGKFNKYCSSIQLTKSQSHQPPPSLMNKAILSFR